MRQVMLGIKLNESKHTDSLSFFFFFFSWLLRGNIFNHFCPVCPLTYLKQFLLYDGKFHLSAVKRVHVPSINLVCALKDIFIISNCLLVTGLWCNNTNNKTCNCIWSPPENTKKNLLSKQFCLSALTRFLSDWLCNLLHAAVRSLNLAVKLLPYAVWSLNNTGLRGQSSTPPRSSRQQIAVSWRWLGAGQ